MFDAFIDSAITAVPVAFALLVLTRETLRARSPQRLAIASTTPQPVATPNPTIEPVKAVPAPQNEPEIVQAAEPTPLAAVPSPADTCEALIRAAKATALRRYCTEAGIRWRDAHGRGKHLSTREMRQALLATGNHHLPWMAA